MCCVPYSVAPIERFSAYNPLPSNCVDANADEDGDKNATLGKPNRKLLSETPDWGIAQQAAKLVANDGAAADRLGAVSISDDGNTLAVGAYGANDKGAAYVYFRLVAGSGLSKWSQRAKLIAKDGKAGDLFGCSVAISGDVIIVGAAGSAHGNRGAAYIFTRDTAGLPSSFW